MSNQSLYSRRPPAALFSWQIVLAGALVLMLTPGPMPAIAAGQPDSASSTPGTVELLDPWPNAPAAFIEAVTLTNAGDHAGAIRKLNGLKLAGNPNVLNYLGFNHRKLGQVDKGISYYKQALAIKPNHKGANEYLGEAYLQKHNLTAARRQLVALERICGKKCEPYVDLARDIAKYQAENPGGK